MTVKAAAFYIVALGPTYNYNGWIRSRVLRSSLIRVNRMTESRCTSFSVVGTFNNTLISHVVSAPENRSPGSTFNFASRIQEYTYNVTQTLSPHTLWLHIDRNLVWIYLPIPRVDSLQPADTLKETWTWIIIRTAKKTPLKMSARTSYVEQHCSVGCTTRIVVVFENKNTSLVTQLECAFVFLMAGAAEARRQQQLKKKEDLILPVAPSRASCSFFRLCALLTPPQHYRCWNHPQTDTTQLKGHELRQDECEAYTECIYVYIVLEKARSNSNLGILSR